MRSFVIEPYIIGKRGCVYTIRFLDKDLSEADAFFAKEVADIENKTTFQFLRRRIENACEKFGLSALDTKQISKPTDGLCELKQNKLRLFCIRFGNLTLILGSGGEKNSRTYNEDSDLNAMVTELQLIDKLFLKRKNDGEIAIQDNGKITGNLTFYLEDDDNE